MHWGSCLLSMYWSAGFTLEYNSEWDGVFSIASATSCSAITFAWAAASSAAFASTKTCWKMVTVFYLDTFQATPFLIEKY